MNINEAAVNKQMAIETLKGQVTKLSNGRSFVMNLLPLSFRRLVSLPHSMINDSSLTSLEVRALRRWRKKLPSLVEEVNRLCSNWRTKQLVSEYAASLLHTITTERGIDKLAIIDFVESVARQARLSS